MRSIRVRQLLWLVVLFLLVWAAMVVSTYLESRHEVEELFDAQLAQAARVLARLPAEGTAGGPARGIAGTSFYGHRYEKKIAYQLWEDGRLLQASASAPATPMAESPGFSDRRLAGARWRVFVLPLAEAGRRVVVGEDYAVRNELIGEIVLNALYPLTLVIPLLVALIWWGLGQGLVPLRRLAGELRRRSPDDLRPIEPGQDIPREIEPLTDALDGLLGRLRAAFERERRFTADAAHELRTPLAGLKTQAQVALRAGSPEDQRHALRQVVAGVDRMTRLVEQLLTLARLTDASPRRDLAPVGLSALAAQAVAALSEQAREAGVALGLDAREEAWVRGDPDALAILLRNLVDNALRYGASGGRVDVSVRPGGSGAVLAVTDAGPGIPAGDRERVLERFYRGGGEARPGSGLGLAIVRDVARWHGARLDLEAGEGGRGLSVRVAFPATLP